MTPEPKAAGSKSRSAKSAGTTASTRPTVPSKAPSSKGASAGRSRPAVAKGPASAAKTASRVEPAGAKPAATAPRRGRRGGAQPTSKLASRGAAGKKGATAATAGPQSWRATDIDEAFRRFHAANPEPRGELAYVNPFTLLVAVVLSAQATDAGVNKATPALFAAADTPEKMVALGEARVRDMIKTIGLFRTKARNVVALSQRLIAEHGGMVPPVREQLEQLPGVGRKTANVVLNIAFGEDTIAVDTHIFRVGNRTGMAPGRNPLEVETALEQRVPAAWRRHAHHWLILHGRYVCKAQRPLCEKCVIADLCRWPQKTTPVGATAS